MNQSIIHSITQSINELMSESIYSIHFSSRNLPSVAATNAAGHTNGNATCTDGRKILGHGIHEYRKLPREMQETHGHFTHDEKVWKWQRTLIRGRLFQRQIAHDEMVRKLQRTVV